MSATGQDTLYMSVESKIVNKIEKNNFVCAGNALHIVKNAVETLTEYFSELAHK